MTLPLPAAPDTRIIETLGWNGDAFARLDAHLARAGRTAQALGYAFDDAVARAALGAAVGNTALRVRLTIGAAGDCNVTVAPLAPTPAVWRVRVAAPRLSSSDPWLRHKTTQRAIYDAARAALPVGIDEALFLNERGEVCEGTITTLFFDIGTGLSTPPLHCGLLPGILRADMLGSGHCAEAILMADDLPRARLWVGNSLRGLIPVAFVAG